MNKEENQKKEQINSNLRLIIEPEKEIPMCGFQIKDINKVEQVNFTVTGNDNKKEINPELAEGKTFDPNEYLFLWNSQKMLKSSELDLLADKVKSAKLPDMFFGYNRFFIIFPQSKNLVLEISPLRMMDYTNYDVIQSSLVDVNTTSNTKPDSNSSSLQNCSYYYPVEVKSQFWDKWKNIKVPEQTVIESQIATGDWAYSSPYMGEFFEFLSHPIYKEVSKGTYQYLKVYENKEKENTNVSFKRELTTETIPFEKLTQENPVLKYWEIPLFDDELNDNGLSMGNFRVRVMKDCLFGLLRNYLRVDNVIVRIVDTRIYHEFGSNVILRDFQVRESTYDELKSKSFDLGSQWSLNHAQSDMVYQYLDLKLHINDKLTIIKEN